MGRTKGSKNKVKTFDKSINTPTIKNENIETIDSGSVDEVIINKKSSRKKFNCSKCNAEIKIFSDCLKEKDIKCPCSSKEFKFGEN